MSSNYVKACFIRKNFDISDQTLRKWADSGKIKSIKIKDSDRRLYDYQDFQRIIGIPQEKTICRRKKVCYARVSSDHQKKDLERQIEFLQKKFPEYEIIKDIGSGLNWNRKGLQTLLEQIYKKDIEEVVVSHQDRLSRFGFEFIQWLCKISECKLVVLNKNTDCNPELELSQDVLSIINFFTARNNGLRSAMYRKERTSKIEKNKALSKHAAEDDSE